MSTIETSWTGHLGVAAAAGLLLLVGLLAPPAAADEPELRVTSAVQQVRLPADGEIGVALSPDPSIGQSGSAVVHDAQGAVVRRLTMSPTGTGTFLVQWDGRDDQGALLSAGHFTITPTVTDGEGHAWSTAPQTMDIQALRTTATIGPRQRVPWPPRSSVIGSCAAVARDEVGVTTWSSRPGCNGDNSFYTLVVPESGVAQPTLSRMIRTRVEIYGQATPSATPLALRMKWAVPAASSFYSEKQSVSGTLGWHYTGWLVRRTNTRAGATNWAPGVELSMAPTNVAATRQWEVRFMRVRYTYREWFTPEA